MAARWKYLYELWIYGDPSVAYGQELLAEGFNTHLNSRVTEGWELVSADYPKGAIRWGVHLIWRR